MAKTIVDKVLVTNRGALEAKYGAAYASDIVPALAALIAADKARGVTTRLVRLDNASDMKKAGAAAVAKAASASQNKSRDRRGVRDVHAGLPLHRRRARRGASSAARQPDRERWRRDRVERPAVRVRCGVQPAHRPLPAAHARGRAPARRHWCERRGLSRGVARDRRGRATRRTGHVREVPRHQREGLAGVHRAEPRQRRSATART